VDEERALGVLTLLNDDMRRRLYHFVRRSGHPVTREEAATELRVSAKLAAFHLDRLTEGGLLAADFETPRGFRRRVGRAPKRYRPAMVEITLSLPPRRYDLMGEILIDALGQTGAAGRPVNTARRVAFERGRQTGARRREELRRGRLGAERALAEARCLLEGLGFEPAEVQPGLILRNCPFQALAQRDPALVCGLNVSFVDGLLRGLGNTTVTAELMPETGLCCVRLRPSGNPRADTQVSA
jgi:predicted ArsR family transcriptional regulator